MLLAADGLFSYGNYIEAGLWIVVAAVFAVFAGLKTGRVRTRCLLAVPTFLLFGISDIVEVSTGAWWKPWWLLVWKAACIAAMLALLTDYLRNPTTNTKQDDDKP